MASIIHLKKCGSTNEQIEHFLSKADQEIISLYTFNQTNGKGQYGNTWQSAENLNIAFSIAVPVNLIKLSDHLFNFHTALLLADFVAIMTKTPAELKWPNDLIIKNKKVAGILIEKKNIGGTVYFIIGIGLNVLQENFQDLTRAGSLLTQTELTFNLETLVQDLHEFLLENLTLEISSEELLVKINKNLFRRKLISVFEIKGIRQNGIIKEVDANGFLWVDLEKDGLQKFYHKEIELLY